MTASTKRAQNTVGMLLVLAGLASWLILPGLPMGRAISAHTVGAAQSRSGLDPTRQAALERLQVELKAGGSFSLEEQDLLRRFAAGEALSELEADTLISRALYDYYVTGNELSREQQELLGRYSDYVARRSTELLDRKVQARNQRIAAAATAPPRNAPAVAPVNDTCAGAIIIPAAGPFPVNTTAASGIGSRLRPRPPTL
jgi:predicted metalloprotease